MDSDYFLDHADRFAGAARASDDEIDREVAAIGEAIRERVDTLLAEIEDRSRPATGMPDWVREHAAQIVIREFSDDSRLAGVVRDLSTAIAGLEIALCGSGALLQAHCGRLPPSFKDAALRARDLNRLTNQLRRMIGLDPLPATPVLSTVEDAA